MIKELFITGIDTNIGKSIATGLIAKFLYHQDINTITQKMVQTGCTGISEDILIHRKIMGVDLFPEDMDHRTCPYLFKYPASPHLAATMEKRKIDPEIIHQHTIELKKKFDLVLMEGAGGLHVPLNRQSSIIDYIDKYKMPVVMVSSSKLGSINHTLLSLDALKQRNIDLRGVVYNTYPGSDPYIAANSIKVIADYLYQNKFEAKIIEVGTIDTEKPPLIDFSSFFKII
ncbi:MAG: ATP-dependent dethiobiotin synthetase BioD [Desulfobacteraceae bacterium]|nr:ATP-dependent dethiobiotin synthetase BioD [Desulfobacteraceae bacterium]